ncbi:hypothetical protein P171DRAFT_73466 [Karstenula rhodostoma CBS 690.94]|uniref:Uncharacterized protein n=1 Tax=Karstenula rhodostoma CBS 690.94 TaxID=1392251 RepID=A0A9P4U7S1_9PLEO|nr:hypothetical protein P171DRAFT_73466 [Karstenula rhodostoma CBS 690.94]
MSESLKVSTFRSRRRGQERRAVGIGAAMNGIVYVFYAKPRRLCASDMCAHLGGRVIFVPLRFRTSTTVPC